MVQHSLCLTVKLSNDNLELISRIASQIWFYAIGHQLPMPLFSLLCTRFLKGKVTDPVAQSIKCPNHSCYSFSAYSWIANEVICSFLVIVLALTWF